MLSIGIGIGIPMGLRPVGEPVVDGQYTFDDAETQLRYVDDALTQAYDATDP